MRRPEVTRLYKYFKYNANSLAMLANGKVWASKPIRFNDPFDCAIRLTKENHDEYVDLLIEEFLSRGYIDESKIDEIRNLYLEDGKLKPGYDETFKQAHEFVEANIERAGVLSLTELNDNILMWAHYTDSHKGFCVKFARNSSVPLGNDEICWPVTYQSDFPSVTIVDSLRDPDATFSAQLFTKSIDWAYEKEWRLIVTIGDTEAPLPAEISAIIFGLRMSQNHRDTIINILSSWKPHVKYKQARIVPGEYKLDIVAIDDLQ